ncbi:putative gluconokinase [Echria macrotheca]|uniref:Gluconokinase n=1 Tax=Echria macrotheca TaxID=438768 RepID=A0AAJ0BI98_9PEZI|nr:putative gluconokinase [Echria macrotheca]
MGDIPHQAGTSITAPNGDTSRTDQHHGHRWIWFVTGPTACGKTTIAKALAADLGFTFVEGDDYHPKANVEKMSRGEPLTDADRAGWLEALRDHETVQPSDPSSSPHLVMTCSALKRHYRDVLREGGERAGNLRIRFVFLDAPEEVLVRRAAERKGHFAGPNLVHSQFAVLERPGEDEGDVLVVRTDGRGIEDTEREVGIRVREAMMEDDGSYLRLL